MTKVFVTVLMYVTSNSIAFGQNAHELELAKLLMTDEGRPLAIAKLRASGGKDLHLLLSWAQKPPDGLDKQKLYIGIADTFGAFPTREAIPFLVSNVGLERHWIGTSIWMKRADVIEGRLPAVHALVRIGPEAGKALIRAFWETMKDRDDRMAAIFAVGQIGGPEARAFLTKVMKESNERERRWAEICLGHLER